MKTKEFKDLPLNYQSVSPEDFIDFLNEVSPELGGVTNLGVFADIQGLGAVATYVEGYNDADDVRTYIYLFDENRHLISPDDGYIGNAKGGEMTKQTNNMRLISGANSSGVLQINIFTASVKYIFVSAARNLKRIRVYAKQTYEKMPFQSHYVFNKQYPYFPINNTGIVTSQPMVGKRLYSTVDGAEYVCTAVTDGVETWVKKALS